MKNIFASRLFFIFPVFLFLLSGAASVIAQDKDSDEVIKIETTLVSVPVTVSDRQGRYVPNLKADDFTLFENGKPQKIEFFAATEEPLNIALLIDTSQSTREVLDEIKDAALDFVKELKPQDKAMIVSFDYEPHILSPLTADREQLNRAVRRADIGEYFGTTLNDALQEVVNQSFARVKGRKAVIVLTDGKDAGSQMSGEDLLYALEESDAPVYTIFYKTGNPNNRNGMSFPRRQGGVFGGRFPRGGGRFPNPQRGGEQRRERVERKNLEAEEFLQEVADKTGGRAFKGEVSDLKKTFNSITDELRYQYRLGFYPSEESKNNPALRELKVKVAHPDVIVRARSSYRGNSRP